MSLVSFAAAQAGVMSCGNLWDMGSQTTMNAQSPQICGSMLHAPCSPRDHWKFQVGAGGEKIGLKIGILKGKFDPKPEISVVRRREFKSFMEEYQYESFLE